MLPVVLAEAVLWKCSIIKRCSLKFLKLTEKCLCWGIFFNSATGWRCATLLKKDSSTCIF